MRVSLMVVLCDYVVEIRSSALRIIRYLVTDRQTAKITFQSSLDLFLLRQILEPN